MEKEEKIQPQDFQSEQIIGWNFIWQKQIGRKIESEVLDVLSLTAY